MPPNNSNAAEDELPTVELQGLVPRGVNLQGRSLPCLLLVHAQLLPQVLGELPLPPAEGGPMPVPGFAERTAFFLSGKSSDPYAVLCLPAS